MYRKLLVDKPYVEIAGIKWATMNIGANVETDYGLYFQWGDTAGYTSSQCRDTGHYKKSFSFADCALHNGTKNSDSKTFTKYNGNDNKTVLEETDDAAVANWGGKWRMPTKEEFAALSAATKFINSSGTEITGTNKLTALSGVTGIYLEDKTDSSKKLFFPMAGSCISGSFNDGGSNGDGSYWSSSLDSSIVTYAYYMSISYRGVYWQSRGYRYYGLSIRPVWDDSIE